jgi:hypothetical protein
MCRGGVRSGCGGSASSIEYRHGPARRPHCGGVRAARGVRGAPGLPARVRDRFLGTPTAHGARHRRGRTETASASRRVGEREGALRAGRPAGQGPAHAAGQRRLDPSRRTAAGRHPSAERREVPTRGLGALARSRRAGRQRDARRREPRLPGADPDLPRDRQRRGRRRAGHGHPLPAVQQRHRLRPSRRRPGRHLRDAREAVSLKPGDV